MIASTQDPDDDLVVRRFRAGDAAAFESLYQRERKSITSFVVSRVGRREESEDLVQETFARAWARRQSLRDTRRVRVWLLAIARNLTADHLRKALVRSDAPLDFSLAVDTERVAAVRGDLALALAAAPSLAPRYREVLDLAVSQGLSASGIAEVMGISRAHAAVLLHRARGAIRTAGRTLLVARSARDCERMRALAPDPVLTLTFAQRASIERHVRRCPRCHPRAAAASPPFDLGVVGALATLGAPASAAPVPRVRTATRRLAAPAALLAIVAVSAVAAGPAPARAQRSAAPGAFAPLHPPPTAGRVFVTGDDPDVHASTGPNRPGARGLIDAAVAYVTRRRPRPHLLLITGTTNPGGTRHTDSRVGLGDAGLNFDVASAGGPASLDLSTVDFAQYDALVVASDFGGWLGQRELDTLVARRDALARYLAGGGGLVAFAEGGTQPAAEGRPTTEDNWFGFLPLRVLPIPVSETASHVMVTAAGTAIGLRADNEGNYLHCLFAPTQGATVVETDATGRTLAFVAEVPPH